MSQKRSGDREGSGGSIMPQTSKKIYCLPDSTILTAFHILVGAHNAAGAVGEATATYPTVNNEYKKKNLHAHINQRQGLKSSSNSKRIDRNKQYEMI